MRRTTHARPGAPRVRALLAGALLLPALAAAQPTPSVDPVVRRVRVATGVRLNYAELGDSTAHALILLHGLSDSWRSFDRVVRPLARTHRVLALDARGHGDSERPEGAYTPERMADDVVAFMDALGLRRATVVGHSMGGGVVMRLLERAPDRLAGAVIVDGVPGPNDAVRALAGELLALGDSVPRRFARDFQYGTVHAPVPAAFMEGAVDASMKVPLRVWKSAIVGIRDALPADVSRARVPALVIVGEHDAVFTVAETRAFAARIAGARVLVYEDTGHTPQWEHPGRFARDVAAFTRAMRAAQRPAAARRRASSRIR